MPRETSEYSICRSAMGCTAWARRSVSGADLGKADLPHIARLDELGDGTHGLLDGHRGIQASRAVDVDVVRAEATKGVGEEVLDGGGTGVHAHEAALRIAQRAELHAQLDPFAVALAQRPAYEQLVVAHAVEVARVQEGDAGVDRCVNRGGALPRVGRPVEGRHPHAPKSQGAVCDD